MRLRGFSDCIEDKEVKLLQETYGQAATMTVCEGPDTNAEECGHWYSPAEVARLIAAEREECAKVCEQHDEGSSFRLRETLADAIRARSNKAS